LFGDEPHLQRGSRSNPTYRYRDGTWLLRSTSDTREHRRELRKGRIDRGLLRTGFIRARWYVDTDTSDGEVLRNDVHVMETMMSLPSARGDQFDQIRGVQSRGSDLPARDRTGAVGSVGRRRERRYEADPPILGRLKAARRLTSRWSGRLKPPLICGVRRQTMPEGDRHLDRATVDRLLTTTRTVRRRLDLSKPVEPEVSRVPRTRHPSAEWWKSESVSLRRRHRSGEACSHRCHLQEGLPPGARPTIRRG
jgi:hypothetical protein